MNKSYKKYLATLIVSIATLSSVSAQELRDDYFYFGADIGASVPAVKFFRDEETNTVSRLTKSKMFGARVGYSFYPGMMIEFATTHQPSYDFSYEIPGEILDSNENAHGSVKAKIESYFVNLVYQMPAKAFGLKPYVMAGLGISTIRTSPVRIPFPEPLEEFTLFSMDKNKGTNFTYHFGGGVTREISKHFEVDFGLKLQIVNGVKFKYNSYDLAIDGLKVDKRKKTLVAGQFTIGLKINL